MHMFLLQEALTDPFGASVAKGAMRWGNGASGLALSETSGKVSWLKYIPTPADEI